MLATTNAAKARELAALLTGIPYRLRSVAEFPGVTLPPEGADSYVANALGKARAAAAATGMLALADDSGIEVDALGGAPGVLSARFGGEGLSDAERCAKMLEALKGVLPLKRSARYRCVIAIAEPGGREATAEGEVDGHPARPAHGHRRLRLRSALLLSAAGRHLRPALRGGEARGEPSGHRDGARPRAAAELAPRRPRVLARPPARVDAGGTILLTVA